MRTRIRQTRKAAMPRHDFLAVSAFVDSVDDAAV
jgi:hypothetical protein